MCVSAFACARMRAYLMMRVSVCVCVGVVRVCACVHISRSVAEGFVFLFFLPGFRDTLLPGRVKAQTSDSSPPDFCSSAAVTGSDCAHPAHAHARTRTHTRAHTHTHKGTWRIDDVPI